MEHLLLTISDFFRTLMQQYRKSDFPSARYEFNHKLEPECMSHAGDGSS